MAGNESKARGQPRRGSNPADWDAPKGSEKALIVEGMTRVISEMEASGGAPLGMMRALHDDGREDTLFVYGNAVMLGMSFDRRGLSRAIYVHDSPRELESRFLDSDPATEMEAFQQAMLRPAKEAVKHGRQEVGLRYVKIHGISGLEAYNPDLGTSACFAFDRAGTLWGTWHGWDAAPNKVWLATTIGRLKSEGRI